jgi:hypothetical protein
MGFLFWLVMAGGAVGLGLSAWWLFLWGELRHAWVIQAINGSNLIVVDKILDEIQNVGRKIIINQERTRNKFNAEQEVERLRSAIALHKSVAQAEYGDHPETQLPEDLALWAVLDEKGGGKS